MGDWSWTPSKDEAPPAVIEKLGDLLPTPLKWRVFFSRQERNLAYLKARRRGHRIDRHRGRRARPRHAAHRRPGPGALSAPAIDPSRGSVDTEA
jgi:hypothetical protein